MMDWLAGIKNLIILYVKILAWFDYPQNINLSLAFSFQA